MKSLLCEGPAHLVVKAKPELQWGPKGRGPVPSHSLLCALLSCLFAQ